MGGDAVGQHPGDILDQAAAGYVGYAFDHAEHGHELVVVGWVRPE